MKYIIIVSIIFLFFIITFLILNKIKKEHFTLPNFIQILPNSYNTDGIQLVAPEIVTFTPIYINEISPFTIDFGDNSQKVHIQNNEIYEHEYKNAGTYNGTIKFDNSCKVQNFTIKLD